ncbi:pejvakin-like [Watersipora subatra]|uniref:pejvakin-like n=1 Tax=Watersipora subatra TaxID=2589382 RepID=UPI00355BC800
MASWLTNPELGVDKWMFKVAVNNLVQSIGGEVYLPSPSMAASKNLAPLSLVERKNSWWRINHSDYYTTDFVLENVLEETHLAQKVEMASTQSFCTFNRESTVKVDALLKGYVKGIFDAGVSRLDSMKIKTELGELIIVEVDIQSLVDHINERKLRMNHQLVKEVSKSKRKALCVVTGVVRTVSSASISIELGAETRAHLQTDKTMLDTLSSSYVIKGKITGTHETESHRELNLPTGTTVAYQLSELSISKQAEVEVMVAHGSKGGFRKAT